jgi:EAL domain-containing protein (putative c-di-GMP-specific phosphodiesterase class I)
MRKNKMMSVPVGADNPLNAAVTSRDRGTLDMVAQAIKNNQAMLAFQPVVIAGDTGRVGFYEGLIRVLDETGRIIPAREFMSIVERAELGREIDVVALNLGLKTLHRNPSLRLSINMSARSIGYHRWMQTLQRWVKKDSTLGERLILEITESSAMDQPELVIDFVARLRKSNISFALDDFGSGYTALKYLKNFLFDVLKIDMLFCDGIAEDPDMQILTRAIADIGQHFDMLVVAEGVERQADAEMLTQMGVDCLQGYYFAAPSIRPDWLLNEKSGKRGVRPKAGQRA